MQEGNVVYMFYHALVWPMISLLSYAWRVLGGFNHMVWLFGKRSDLEPDLPHKEIGDKEPYYSTKSSIFSFIWAGLAALHKASTI